MSRKKVYIAYTGGTIGMKRTEDGYRPESGHLQKLMLEMPELRNAELPEQFVHEYEPLLDSSDMSSADWLRIAREIAGVYDQFDGFVVLHGTDTLAYTASALSFMLRGLQKPVIVTGSQVPLGELRSDGRRNLVTALIFAGGYDIPEVCVYFDGRLLRGNRTVKVNADRFEAFESPNFPPLGVSGTRIEINRQLLHRDAVHPLEVRRIGDAKVGAVRLFPGIPSDVLANILQPPLQGLVLECYGAGNGPVRNERFMDALREATERGVVIVDVTQCLRGRVNLTSYTNGAALEKAGVISGHDMTVEAALTKLFYLFEQQLPPEEVKRLVQTNLRGELTEGDQPGF